MAKLEKRAGHQQVWTKVNVPVDIEIKPLIDALALFPELQTVESCQKIGNGKAWVCFVYGRYWEHGWRDMANFVLGFFGSELYKLVDNTAVVQITVVSEQSIYGELTVPPEQIRFVAESIRKIAKKWRKNETRNI